jgi:hypothetical protein
LFAKRGRNTTHLVHVWSRYILPDYLPAPSFSQGAL